MLLTNKNEDLVILKELLQGSYISAVLNKNISVRNFLDKPHPEVFFEDNRYISSPIPQYSVQEYRRHNYYVNNYSIIGAHALHDFCYPKPIGRRLGIPTCRFCNKSRPEASFRRDAHVIPKFTGNESWKSFEECDSCNDIFSKYESHLGSFTNFERTISFTKGYGGVPKFENEHFSMKPNQEEQSISLFSKQNIISDASNTQPNSADIFYKIPPYRPINVYKALAKSAMSAWPSEDLKSFESLRLWLINADDLDSLSYCTKCICWKHSIRGPFRYRPPFLYLLRRRENSAVPYATAVIGFGLSVFQIYLPSPEQDSMLAGARIELVPFIPPAIGNLKSKGVFYNVDALYMESPELTREEKSSIRFYYGRRWKI